MKEKNQPNQFRKKPVVIEAVQFTDESFEECVRFLGSSAKLDMRAESIIIPTLEGPMNVSLGDWIIKGVKGEFYPCKPDIFAASYEAADAAPTVPFEAATGALHWSLVIPQRVAGMMSHTVNGKGGKRYFFMQRGNEFVLEFKGDYAAFEAAAVDIYTSSARTTRGYSIVPRVAPAAGWPAKVVEEPQAEGGTEEAPAQAPTEAEMQASRRSSEWTRRQGQLMRMQPYDLQPLIKDYGLAVNRHADKPVLVGAILAHEFEDVAQGGTRKAEKGTGEAPAFIGDADQLQHLKSDAAYQEALTMAAADKTVPVFNGNAAPPYTEQSLQAMEWNALKAFAASKGVTASSKKAIIAELLDLLPPAVSVAA